jgi:hypothetical protein
VLLLPFCRLGCCAGVWSRPARPAALAWLLPALMESLRYCVVVLLLRSTWRREAGKAARSESKRNRGMAAASGSGLAERSPVALRSSRMRALLKSLHRIRGFSENIAPLA